MNIIDHQKKKRTTSTPRPAACQQLDVSVHTDHSCVARYCFWSWHCWLAPCHTSERYHFSQYPSALQLIQILVHSVPAPDRARAQYSNFYFASNCISFPLLHLRHNNYNNNYYYYLSLYARYLQLYIWNKSRVRACKAAAILWLQFMIHVIVFPTTNIMYFTLVLHQVRVQHPVWLFSVVY
jgi:hypothetical protein